MLSDCHWEHAAEREWTVQIVRSVLGWCFKKIKSERKESEKQAEHNSPASHLEVLQKIGSPTLCWVMCFPSAMALSASPQQLMLDCFQTTKAAATEEPSAKVGRQGSKQAEGRRSPHELPIKDDTQGRCPSPREKSSILQQGNPVSPGPLVLFTPPHSGASGCSTGAEVSQTPCGPHGWWQKTTRKGGMSVSSWEPHSAEQRERKQFHLHLYRDTWNARTCNLPFFRPPPGKIISLTSQLQKKVIINLAAFQEVDEIFLSRWPTSRAQRKNVSQH